MMRDDDSLSVRALLVESRSLLTDGGYKFDEESSITGTLGELCFIAEDAFGVVLVVTYPTWSSLRENWRDAQAALVKLISEKLSKSNPKAWEGYLVILTPAVSGDERAEDEIRYDTSRVRKIVGTGESIRFISDVRDVLMPLLPLDASEAAALEGAGSVLDRLPGMLVERNINRNVAATVVDAFKSDEPLLESILRVLKS
jgi:hypothetical protein